MERISKNKTLGPLVFILLAIPLGVGLSYFNRNVINNDDINDNVSVIRMVVTEEGVKPQIVIANVGTIIEVVNLTNSARHIVAPKLSWDKELSPSNKMSYLFASIGTWEISDRSSALGNRGTIHITKK
jgi:hypothetical protein